jgi:hypothetical protein
MRTGFKNLKRRENATVLDSLVGPDFDHIVDAASDQDIQLLSWFSSFF